MLARFESLRVEIQVVRVNPITAVHPIGFAASINGATASAPYRLSPGRREVSRRLLVGGEGTTHLELDPVTAHAEVVAHDENQ